MIIPMIQIAINVPKSFGRTALRSMMIDGSESVVTAIMKERTVPSSAPLASKASAIGITPKMSAYMGTPSAVVRITPNGLFEPRTISIHSSGIQL